jgi:hypothetical protein
MNRIRTGAVVSEAQVVTSGGPSETLRPATLPVTAAVEEPRILDTYSTFYALTLFFLLPAMRSLTQLPFGDDRSAIYTPAYVSLVTVPFLLGLIATFLLDSRDGAKRTLLRIVVLTPIVVITGVTVMFLASAIMIPASKLLGIADQGLTALWWVALAVVSAPLLVTVVRIIRHPDGWRGVVRIVAILGAVALLVGLAVFTFTGDRNIYEIWRKDVVIYVVGALSWYLPSFGIAAGFWRRTGLV